METIKIDSGIRKFAITNENDEQVAVLRIDTKDDRLQEKIINLYKQVSELKDNIKKEMDDIPEGSESPDDALKIVILNRKAVQKLIDETNKVFGENFIQDVLREHFEHDPEYVPDATAVIDIYAAITPVLEQVLRQKNDKYSVNFKGNK